MDNLSPVNSGSKSEATQKPKEITKCVDCGVEMASFGYYEGIRYAKEKGLHHTTNYEKVYHGTHYMVCCGDVMVRVDATLFTDIERREI
jgi:hypothetical protein